MPAINWTQVGDEAITAAKNVLSGSWNNVSKAALPQIEAMISIGRSIEQDKINGTLTQSEYELLEAMQKNAMKGILSSYEAVGIVVAEQAATAAWNVLASALKGAGVAFI